jgi:hypothetical protein
MAASIFGSILAYCAMTAQIPSLEPGQKLTLSARSDRWVPAATSQDGYRRLLLAVRNANKEQIVALFPGSLDLLKAGSKIEIIEMDRLGKKTDYLRDPSVGNVAAVVVKTNGSDNRYWIPLVYLETSEKPTAIADRFPMLDFAVDAGIVLGPGNHAILFREDGSTVPIAKNMSSFEAMIKAGSAGDNVGMRELFKAKRIAAVDVFTPVLVIERHANPFLAKGVRAIEGRTLSGPYKDQSCGLPESFVGKRTITVTPRKMPLPAKRSKSKKSM